MAAMIGSPPETFTVRDVESLFRTADQSVESANVEDEKIVQRMGDFFRSYGISFESTDRLVEWNAKQFDFEPQAVRRALEATGTQRDTAGATTYAVETYARFRTAQQRER